MTRITVNQHMCLQHTFLTKISTSERMTTTDSNVNNQFIIKARTDLIKNCCSLLKSECCGFSAASNRAENLCIYLQLKCWNYTGGHSVKCIPPQSQLHCVSKKVPTFKLSVTSSNLNRFSKFCTAGKRMKFATKPIQHYPSHLRYVATLS